MLDREEEVAEGAGVCIALHILAKSPISSSGL
jgi:hypothetical protein